MDVTVKVVAEDVPASIFQRIYFALIRGGDKGEIKV